MNYQCLQKSLMEKWAEVIQNMNFAIGANELTDYMGTAEVRQLDRLGQQLRVYEFNGIWPSQIADIPLAFDQYDTIEEYDVTFCVQYWHAAGKNAENISGLNNWESQKTTPIKFLPDTGHIFYREVHTSLFYCL